MACINNIVGVARPYGAFNFFKCVRHAEGGWPLVPKDGANAFIGRRRGPQNRSSLRKSASVLNTKEVDTRGALRLGQECVFAATQLHRDELTSNAGHRLRWSLTECA